LDGIAQCTNPESPAKLIVTLVWALAPFEVKTAMQASAAIDSRNLVFIALELCVSQKFNCSPSRYPRTNNIGNRLYSKPILVKPKPSFIKIR